MYRKQMFLFMVSILFLLSGCVGRNINLTSEDTPSDCSIDPQLEAYLDEERRWDEDLQSSLQVIEEKVDGEACDIFVRQTVGDAQTLYILYDVTFAEGIDLACTEDESIEPAELQLLKEDGMFLPVNMWGTEVIAEDGQTRTFLTYFCSWDTWQPESTVKFIVGEFQKTDGWKQTSLTDEVAEFLWQPTNQANYLEGTVIPDGEEAIGKVYFSPFGLSFVMDFVDETNLMVLLDEIQVFSKDGHVICPQGRTGATQEGTQAKGMIKFQELIDLDTITGVQIDGQTVMF